MNNRYVTFFSEELPDPDRAVYIGRVQLGVVVQDTYLNEIGNREPANRFGHIVGFAQTCGDVLLIRVQWDDNAQNEYDRCFPSNLILLDL